MEQALKALLQTLAQELQHAERHPPGGQIEDAQSRLRTLREGRPEQEEYWLSYIDALIQADEVPTARQVLELGRQHGLKLQKANRTEDAPVSKSQP